MDIKKLQEKIKSLEKKRVRIYDERESLRAENVLMTSKAYIVINDHKISDKTETIEVLDTLISVYTQIIEDQS